MPASAFFRFVSIISVLSAALNPVTASVLRGKIRDWNGKAISAAQMRLLSADREHLLSTTETTASGDYTFTELPAGDYQLTASGTIFAETSLRNIRLGANETMTIPTFELRPGGFVCFLDASNTVLEVLPAGSEHGAFQGDVLDPQGQPVTTAVVTLFVSGSRLAAARTDDLGHFSFTGLNPNSSYLIQLSSPGYFAETFSKIFVQTGLSTLLEPFTLEPCKPGYCQPYLKEVRVIPGCA